MNLPVPDNVSYGIWMRSPSVSGGKDWLGFVTDREVVSQWGKTGMVQQAKSISDQPSVLDLDRKVREKRAKGYQVLGEYHLGKGWSHLPPPRKPAPKARSAAMAPMPPSAVDKVASWLSTADSREWF
jgi:hypothetical protein